MKKLLAPLVVLLLVIGCADREADRENVSTLGGGTDLVDDGATRTHLIVQGREKDSVQFYVDGKPYGNVEKLEPFEMTVDETTLAAGEHSTEAVAKQGRITYTVGTETLMVGAPPSEPGPTHDPADNTMFARQGYGASTKGGAGGKLYEVKDLAGLKAALSASGPRIIRQVVGTPILTDGPLELRNPNVTIENLFVYNAPGNSAHTLEIETHDVIVTNSRLYNPVQEQKDVVSIKQGAYNILVERSTILFGADESVNSWYDAHDITFSWNIIAYPLNFDAHGYGPLFGAADRNGRDVSFHHNLISTSRYRNPKADILGGFSMWNNVIYNSGQDSNTLLEPNASGEFYAAVVGNYYKSGPNSGVTAAITLKEHGDVYVSGNLQDGAPARTDSESGVRLLGSIPAGLPPMTITSAERAYEEVLHFAGANFAERDAITSQLIEDVIQGTSRVPAGRWVNTPADIGF